MKIINNDLYCNIERWDDPGDYPNSCAGYPLPSYHYCEYGGELVFDSENDDELKNFESVDEWIGDYVYKVCDIGCCSPSYKCKVNGNRCTVTITDAEINEPDYDYPEI